MREAQAALQAGHLGRVRQLVEAHRPRSGQADLRGFEWRTLWLRSRGDAAFTLTHGVGWLNALCFSPDGHLLALRGMDHTLRVWDVVARRERLAIPDAAVLGGFTMQGRGLAFGTRDGAVHLAEIQSGRRLHTIAQAGSLVGLLANGTTVATTSAEFALATWDFPGAKRVQIIPGKGGFNPMGTEFGPATAVSADGEWLAVIEPADAGTNAPITLWHLPSGKPVRPLFIPPPVTFLRFSAENTQLAAGNVHGEVQTWNVAQGRESLPRLKAHADTVFTAAFSPDGRLLATGSEDETIRLWAMTDGRCRDTLRGHEAGVWTLSFAPDGKLLASGSQDGTVRLWNVGRQRPRHTLEGLTSNVRVFHWQHLAWSPDSTRLASGCQDSTVRIWETATLEPRGALPAAAQALSFGPEPDRLLVRLENGSLGFWDTKSPQALSSPLRGLPVEGRPCLAVSPDGQRIAGATLSGGIELGDVTTGERQTLVGHDRQVASLAFSSDGRFLISGDWNGVIRKWDLTRQQSVAVFADTRAGVASPVTAVALAPDGQTLATGGTDRGIKIWDLPSARLRWTLSGHRGPVWTLAFSPDSRTLASGSGDHTVRLWSMALGQEVSTLNVPTANQAGPEAAVSRVAFSPDGNNLAALTRSGRLQLWRAASLELAAVADDTTPP